MGILVGNVGDTVGVKLGTDVVGEWVGEGVGGVGKRVGSLVGGVGENVGIDHEGE